MRLLLLTSFVSLVLVSCSSLQRSNLSAGYPCTEFFKSCQEPANIGNCEMIVSTNEYWNQNDLIIKGPISIVEIDSMKQVWFGEEFVRNSKNADSYYWYETKNYKKWGGFGGIVAVKECRVVADENFVLSTGPDIALLHIKRFKRTRLGFRT